MMMLVAKKALRLGRNPIPIERVQRAAAIPRRAARHHTSASLSSSASGGGKGGGWRYSDGVFDHRRRRWIGVREDHSSEGEPVNAVVAIDLDDPGVSSGHVLAGGHDFFCSARLSPDGNRMLWLAWDHPNMPWNGTTLYLADLDAGGVPATVRVVAGGVTESVFQPEFTPDGNEIIFVSDRTG